MELTAPPSAPTVAASARPYRPISARLDRLYIRRPRVLLLAVVIGYLWAGVRFAVITPAWQNPDEPAHYNNVATIANGQGLPVLRAGDYDEDYLNTLRSQHFPPELSVASLRYEAYQPPLYYLLLAPIYALGAGSLLALRLFNLALGCCALILLYLSVELVFPTKPLLSVGAVAFAAFLPMHVAISASVNNDGLAELLLMATMLALLRWMRQEFYSRGLATQQSPGSGTPAHRRRLPLALILIGVLLGLGMLTKIYAYLALVIVAGIVWIVTWLQPPADLNAPRRRPTWANFWAGLAAVAWVAVPAVLIVLPFLLRNVSLYGAWDLLGMQRHDAVVTGQPTTLAWIHEHGVVSYAERAVSFTFRSFWGVFGWLGVFMDQRVYDMLLVFTGVIGFGLLWALVRFICGRPETDMDRFQFWVLGLFVVLILATTASYAWYNLKFVQHQGRYFFWGILPIATFVALGWRELMQPLQGRVTGFLLGVLALALLLIAVATGAPDKYVIACMAFLALLLMLQPYLLMGSVDAVIVGAPAWLRGWLGGNALQPLLAGLRLLAWAAPFILLFGLDLAIPIWYIGPQLAP